MPGVNLGMSCFEFLFLFADEESDSDQEGADDGTDKRRVGVHTWWTARWPVTLFITVALALNSFCLIPFCIYFITSQSVEG